MQGYSKQRFAAPVVGGKTVSHDIYTAGQGPVVVIIQELPGIGPQTLALAARLRDAGFTTVLPHLFGPLGRISMAGNMVRVLCMRREFRLFEKHASSPIVDWLRALCQDLRTRHGVKGVGTIGMCLTGNFAISLMADDSVLAGVASQPSLPLFDQASVHLSTDELACIRSRLDTGAPMLGFRFADDPLCTAEKFAALDTALNAGRERIRLTTLPGKGHSVLTLDFVDDSNHPTARALQDVIDYFHTTLNTAP